MIMLNTVKAYAVKNLCYISAQKMVPQGIVVHSTGANNPNLKRYVDAVDEVGVNKYGNHWNTPMPDGRKVCVHAFIGYDKKNQIRVAEILPLNICCWGVGKGKKGSYNTNPAYIQFEICEDGLKDKNYYEKVFAVAAEYCAQLCRTYNISVEKIVGHCEAYRMGYGSNHGDPEHWMNNFGETMNDFRKKVANILNETKIELTLHKACYVFKKGDLVSIKQGATYYNGIEVPAWVLRQKWFVKEDSESARVVIDKNENETISICSPIHKNYLCLVQAATKTNEIIDVNDFIKPYLIKVTAKSLNIRKGAGTNYAIEGVINDFGVYTIVEECNGVGASRWGKLKSGIGWISLDYVKKL